MKKIFLLLAPFFLLLLSFKANYSHIINGKITDESGKPIAFVTVTYKGTNISTTSSQAGTYSIGVNELKGALVYSAVGYEGKTIKIEGKQQIDVVLKTSKATLNEVVVVGYGTARKKDVTGAISNYQYDLNLQGAAPGVRVTGYPGYNKTDFNTESYDHITENGFKRTTDDPLSTFSIDVDAASYSNVRRFLNEGKLPPAGAVRVEEMINYFHYDYNLPTSEHPFSVTTEISSCPWNEKHKLVLVGLQGKKMPVQNLPASNFVFLIDVSGSMQDENKLPLVKASLKLLVDQLREQDKVALVVYAGAAGLVLPSTSGSQKTKIKDAIDGLSAGGSTAGGQGIKLAYKVARENFAKDGNNRVVLCTDGDFNVGMSSDDEMERLIEEERKSKVYLTVLGYGMGNYKDSKMQKLADKGNGNHAYIDGLSEAKKVLVNEFSGTMFTIAKDVKLQIEFNPAKVQGYRLVGYENRMLNKEDFNDDKKDAGELGSGHTVTALYEIIPTGVESTFLKTVDSLKYSAKQKSKIKVSPTDEIMNIKLRYKKTDEEVSKLIEHPVLDRSILISQTSDNFRFAAAVAQFGMLLRKSEYKQNSSFENVVVLATKARGNDAEGYRKEFVTLVRKAEKIIEQESDVATVEED